MGIDPAPFWVNLFLYFFESKFIKDLRSQSSERAFLYKNTSRFIDDLCTINDNFDFKETFKTIYPEELDLKLEHEGTHATFLDLDITIRDRVFVYKLFDKRDNFPFLIVCMPHVASNIPSFIFYGATFSEILRIGRCCLLVDDFIARVGVLLKRMHSQGGEVRLLRKQLLKAFCQYPDVFSKYQEDRNVLVDRIFNYHE